MREHGCDPLGVGGKGGRASSAGRGAELDVPQVFEPEELIGVAVLLVVVDQARVWRRGDDPVEAPPVLDLSEPESPREELDRR